MFRLRYASILMSLLTILAGCGVCESYNGLAAGFLGQSTPVPNSDDLRGFSVTRPVIESPLNNTELPLLPFVISTYAGHPAGAILATLLVNGEEVQSTPVTAASDPVRPEIKVMTKIDQTWSPPAAGAYYLQVRVTWATGETEISYPVLVYVGGVPTLDFTQIVNDITATAPTPTGTATATLAASPTFTVTATQPRITFTASATRAATNTLTATPSATTNINAPFTTFSADSTAINIGQCTMLHWTSGNIQSIFLNNQPVTGAENRQVCPTATTTFTLLAHSSAGDISKQVTITVTNNGTPFTTFTADSTSINAGQCTMLHWTSGNIQSIFLNGQAATGVEDRQVCPTTTTLYQLVAHSSSGDITKEITIQVTGSVSNTATNTVSAAAKPEFTGHSPSTNIFDNYADCATNPHSVTFTVTVTNATSVTLFYQVSGGSAASMAMSPAGGNNWTATVTGDSAALPGTPTGTLNYSFSATNATGTTASATFTDVVYNDCSS